MRFLMDYRMNHTLSKLSQSVVPTAPEYRKYRKAFNNIVQ